jgi:transcriptional regulator with XRE-family HTH domain
MALNPHMSLFARNLRFLRKQRGLSQHEVSLQFSKRGNTVGNWENGRSEPGIGDLVKLAEYFKVDLHELLHTDLQEETLHALDTVAGAGSPESQPVAYPIQEPLTSLVQESSGSDLFWFILRELRAINEKLDTLKQVRESGAHKPGSDKIDH